MRVVARTILLGSLLSLLPAAGPVTAQEATNAAPDLVKEIEALRKSVQEAVGLLERALAQQRAELLLKRLDLKERRVVPLESELRRARDAVTTTRSEVERFEQMEEETESRIADAVRSGTDREDSDDRILAGQLEAALSQVRRALESEEDRVRRLEDELAERLDEIEILEDSLRRRLDDLD
jgi:hypothetical protein